MIFSN